MGRTLSVGTWNPGTTYTPGTLIDTNYTLYPNEYVTKLKAYSGTRNITYTFSAKPSKSGNLTIGFRLCNSSGTEYTGTNASSETKVASFSVSLGRISAKTGTITSSLIFQAMCGSKTSTQTSDLSWSSTATKGQHLYIHPYYVFAGTGTLVSFLQNYAPLNMVIVTTEDNYTLSSAVSPSGGGSVTLSATSVAAESTATITATPATGYKFSSWSTTAGTLADSSSASTTITMPHQNAKVTANFTKQSYTLTTTVSPSGSGTVTAGGSIQYGSTKSLTATANAGYSFSSWSKTAGTLSSTTSNPTTFTMGASAATVTANFTKNSYTLTTAVSPSGAGTVTAGGSIQYGSTKSLTATAATGYTFSSWSKTAGTLSSTTSNPTTFTMGTSAATVTANFTHNQYTLTLSTSPSGGGTATGGGTKYYADSCSISATAATGYSFVNWTTSSGGTIANASSASTTYTMPNGNATVTANFSINSYTLTVQASPSGGGTVTGGGTFNYGSTNTITATAATGYQFAGWSTTSGTLADASSATTTLTLAASDATVTATFTKIDYTVTTAANPVGSGTVSANPSMANYGDTVTLSQTPASGYDFDSWSSSPSVTITNGQFVMPASNVTITANYIVGNKLYFKSNGNWVEVSKAYKKINGSWVEQSDVTTVFDSQTSYVKGN